MPPTARTPLTAESIDQVLASSTISTSQISQEREAGSARPSIDSTRPSRSTSSASRNRLSLTLPIAPPNCIPSRATPTSTINGSFPPTPAELRSSSSLTSPAEPADLVRAIAAQEQKVLELRDSLKHAEHELRKLRKAYQQNAHKSHHRHPSHLPAAASDADASDDAVARKRALELDRRRAVLAAQQQNQHVDGRKRVLRGQHTRALSLVSPTKSSASEFEELTDDGQDSASTSSVPTAPTPTRTGPNRSALHNRNHSMLSKRATWNIGTKQTAGIKQFADDFRTGLWTFVDDIRQVTIGEETTAVRSSTMDPTPRPARSTAVEMDDGGDTIRASNAARPKASALFDDPTLMETPSKAPVPQRPKVKRQDSKNKRFSYTPLTEDLNDDDWSNWDSPTIGVPSPRWSGSTVGNNESTSSAHKEELISVADGSSVTPSKSNSASNRQSLQFLQGTGLEDLSWQAIHKLSPSNLKRTATNLMDQWEKSLNLPDGEPHTPASPTGTEAALAYPNTAA